MNPLLWTSKSTRHFEGALSAKGYAVSDTAEFAVGSIRK
jgi:hypothetical protein